MLSTVCLHSGRLIILTFATGKNMNLTVPLRCCWSTPQRASQLPHSTLADITQSCFVVLWTVFVAATKHGDSPMSDSEEDSFDVQSFSNLSLAIHFCGFLVVCLAYSRHVRISQKEHFHIHKVVAEQVPGDLVANEVTLKEYC